MPKAWLQINKQRGFSIVEILLAATLFGFLAMALVGALVYGKQSTANAGDRTRAVLLAEEGVDAARNIRDAGFSNLADGTYGLAQSGGQWVLSAAPDITDIYSRQIAISSIDGSRKSVQATVSWANGTVSRQSQVETRLTNWRASIVAPTSWLDASLAGSADTTWWDDGVKVATQGNYAYLVRTGNNSNFVTVDISNPAAPAIVTGGSLSLSSTLTNVFVSGNYAYVTGTNNSAELMIVDISNPAAPFLVKAYNALGNGDGRSVFVRGDYAYLTRSSDNGANREEFMIINVSNPSSPTRVGGYNENIDMNDVAISGNYAFIGTSSYSREVLVMNITNLANPVFSTAYNLNISGTVSALKVTGNTLLVAQGSYVSILDIANPLSFTPTGLITAEGWWWSLPTINDIDADSSGKYVFLGTTGVWGDRQFQVADIASASIVRTVLVPDSATLNGVAYSSMLDVVVGATASDTKEIVIFEKN